MVDERELLLAIVDAAEKFLGTGPVTTSANGTAMMTLLEERIANLRFYELHALEAPTIPAKTRPCEACGASIFFAQDIHGAWAPIEVDKVSAEGMVPAWKWVVNFDRTSGRRGIATVRFDPNVTGLVWVDHRQTCGVGNGPKYKVPSLIRRWKVNAERADRAEDEVMTNLLRMRKHLDSEIWDPNADEAPTTEERHDTQG